MQTAAADTPGKYTKKEIVMEEFRFLKPRKMKHPTTGIDLEYLDKSNAVCIALFNEEKDKILLVEQYRPGNKGLMLEVPAGLIDSGEDPKTAVLREMREETGYSEEDIADFRGLDEGLYASPGYTTEKLYFFSARLKDNNIKPKELNLDHGEDLENEWVDVKDILKKSGDLKTILAVSLFKD